MDKWQSDLRKIASLGEDKAFTMLLEDPRLHFNDKAKLLSERLGDINPLALNLVYLLIAKGRLSIAGEIADQTGIDGNISLDPMFCDLAGRDLTVYEVSPCAPGNNSCGVLMGAYGAACGGVAVKPATWGAIKAMYR